MSSKLKNTLRSILLVLLTIAQVMAPLYPAIALNAERTQATVSYTSAREASQPVSTVPSAAVSVWDFLPPGKRTQASDRNQVAADIDNHSADIAQVAPTATPIQDSVAVSLPLMSPVELPPEPELVQ